MEEIGRARSSKRQREKASNAYEANIAKRNCAEHIREVKLFGGPVRIIYR